MTLDLADVTVEFGQMRAVDRVALTVEEGSIFALIGPSGCGKSTLLRAIAGLVAPRTGTITWSGSDMSALPTEQRDMGFMFQDHALFSHRTVAQNIGFGLRMRKVPAAEQRQRVEELLELVGLSGFGPRSVERLSGGEAQRVALARALAPRPRLLLLDEPLASLDRARRDELNDELARLLCELGQTAIYVTHDQHEAFAIADEVGVMNAGRLVRVGTAADVWRDPQTEFVARFVGHEMFVVRDGVHHVVRADAVSIIDGSPDASQLATETGVVTECRFQGDRYRVTIDVDGAMWRAWSDDGVAVGRTVEMQIDEQRIAPVSD